MIALAASALLLSCAGVSAQTTYPDATSSVSYIIQDEQVLRDVLGGSGSKTEHQVTQAQIDPDGYGHKPSTRYIASVWFQQPFSYAGADYHVAFIKLREIDTSTGETVGAHAATVRVSAITYRKSGDEWEIVARQTRPFAEAGTWGDAEKPNKVSELGLSKTTVALLVPIVETGQGSAYTSQQVMVFDGALWTSAGSINTSADNGGNCNQDGSSPELGTCWSYTGTIQVVVGSGNKMPDLMVVRQGTDYSPDSDKPKRAGNVLYKFKDDTYSSPSAD